MASNESQPKSPLKHLEDKKIALASLKGFLQKGKTLNSQESG